MMLAAPLFAQEGPAFTVGDPWVTEEHPTTIMAKPARTPTTNARIRSRGDLVSPPIRTV
jgi:hypothetical protein